MTKIIATVCLLVIGLVILFAYQFRELRKLTFGGNTFKSTLVIRKQHTHLNQSSHDILNDRLTFERRSHCNYRKKEMCYSTNKSLVVTFWNKISKGKWVSQNILSAFPLHSFDHIIFVHDNSTWSTHPGYKHFIWIHVEGQLRFWYVKRFISPTILKSYKFLWIIDDDAQLTFTPLHYQCVVENLSIPLSSPGRLDKIARRPLVKVNVDFKNRIGRWTDFVDTGPVLISSSLAWQCIYTYLDASTGSGWGLDLIWCNMIVEQCLPTSKDRKACAILDTFGIYHQSTGIKSTADGEPELPIYTKTYKKWLTKRQNIAPLATNNRLIDFCSK